MQRRNIYFDFIIFSLPLVSDVYSVWIFSSYVTLKLNRGSVLMVPLRRDRVTKSKISKVIAHMCRNMFNIFLELDHKKRRKKKLPSNIAYLVLHYTHGALMQPQMHSLRLIFINTSMKYVNSIFLDISKSCIIAILVLIQKHNDI